jgi:hypothetical protein
MASFVDDGELDVESWNAQPAAALPNGGSN